MAERKRKVLMVCLGNSCRSPIAEAVFQDIVNKSNVASEWEVDSAAIASWNVGLRAEDRALKVMTNHGLSYSNKARQISQQDFEKFDYIFGMDEENIKDLNDIKPPNAHAKVLLLGDFSSEKENKIIRDPYYDSGSEGFEKCYQQCVSFCTEFLKQARNNEV